MITDHRASRAVAPSAAQPGPTPGHGVHGDQQPGQRCVPLPASADQRVGLVPALDEHQSPAASASTTVTEVLSRLRSTSRSSPTQAPMTALMATKWDTTTGRRRRSQRATWSTTTRRGRPSTRAPRSDHVPGHRLPQPRHPLPHRHARRRRDLGDERLDDRRRSPTRAASGAAVSRHRRSGLRHEPAAGSPSAREPVGQPLACSRPSVVEPGVGVGVPAAAARPWRTSRIVGHQLPARRPAASRRRRPGGGAGLDVPLGAERQRRTRSRRHAEQQADVGRPGWRGRPAPPACWST